MVFLWEGNLNFTLFADFCTNKLILKARDKAVGTDLKWVILAFATIKCLSINKALEIKCGEITVLDLCTFWSVNHLSLAVTKILDLLVYVLIADLCLILLYLKTLILTKLDFRLRGHRNLKYDVLAFFKCHNLCLRAAYRNDLLLLKRIIKCLWCEKSECLFHKSVLSNMTLNDLPRCLALTEAWYADLIGDALHCTLQCLIKLCCILFNRQNDLLVLDVLCSYIHYLHKPPVFFEARPYTLAPNMPYIAL